MYASHSHVTKKETMSHLLIFLLLNKYKPATPLVSKNTVWKKNREKIIIFNLKIRRLFKLHNRKKYFSWVVFIQTSPRNLYPRILYWCSFVHILQISNYTWETNKGIMIICSFLFSCVFSYFDNVKFKVIAWLHCDHLYSFIDLSFVAIDAISRRQWCLMIWSFWSFCYSVLIISNCTSDWCSHFILKSRLFYFVFCG